MTQKYKINGKEIDLMIITPTMWDDENYTTYSPEVREKINELIQALGEPVKEKKKWDRRELNGGELYFYVGMAGIVDKAIYNFNSHDEWRIKSGNCFETYEQAEAYKQKLIEDNK